MAKPIRPVKGFCFLASEEGDDRWRFQDARFTGIPSDDQQCEICGTIWPAVFAVEPMVAQIIEVEVPEDADGMTRAFAARANETALICRAADKHSWVKAHPQGTWSTEGEIILKEGDWLDIYDPDQGVVVPVFTGYITIEDSWIRGLDRPDISKLEWAAWFGRRLSATLDQRELNAD